MSCLVYFCTWSAFNSYSTTFDLATDKLITPFRLLSTSTETIAIFMY